MKEGDRHAFEELYNRYWHKLYGYLYNRLRCAATSEEIVQEVFVNLWIKRKECEKINSLSAFLFTGAKYLMLNKIKANEVRHKFAEHFSKFANENRWNNTEDHIVEMDVTTALESHIAKLSPRCKEIFELSRRHHLSIADISESLQLSHKTVENQLSKALKYLRLNMKEFLIVLLHVGLFY